MRKTVKPESGIICYLRKRRLGRGYEEILPFEMTNDDIRDALQELYKYENKAEKEKLAGAQAKTEKN